ncbi:MAG: Uma2 family endonuclease [Myxococcota bacterium]|jgi:Uma2 family endonuclease|nr:Uma2 family endonuclease [Myxococcota bacterium]
MSAAAERFATWEDLLAYPEDVRVELIGGSIVTAPAPLPRHSKPQRGIGRFIGGPFDDDDGHGGPGGWWIFLEVDVRFSPHDVVRPDLAGWRRERLPKPGDVRPIDVRPDWVCEILSPSTTRVDRVDKAALYHRAGVPWLWLVDPIDRTIEVREHGPKGWIVVSAVAAPDVVRLPPFEAAEVPLDRIFLPVDPPDPTDSTDPLEEEG